MSYKKLYAVYRGDTFLDVGTSSELCKKFNWTSKTFYHFTGCNRYKKRVENSDNAIAIIKIEVSPEEKKEVFYGT